MTEQLHFFQISISSHRNIWNDEKYGFFHRKLMIIEELLK